MIRGSARFGAGGLAMAGLVTVMLSPGFGIAQGVDVPEQIGTQDGSALDATQVLAPGATEQIAPADKTLVDEIQIGETGDKTQVEQTEGGRDLCGPDVSEAKRKRLGVKCDADMAGQHPAGTRPVGTAGDPLLQPREDDAREQFESLNLGDEVPATVILQN